MELRIRTAVGRTSAAFEPMFRGTIEGASVHRARSSVARGPLPWSQRIPLIMAALGGDAVLAFYTLQAIEAVAGRYGSRKEGERIALELEALIGAGHTHLRIGDAAGIWAGAGSSDSQKNVCLRRIM